jgi:hypothetical protein
MSSTCPVILHVTNSVELFAKGIKGFSELVSSCTAEPVAIHDCTACFLSQDVEWTLALWFCCFPDVSFFALGILE